MSAAEFQRMIQTGQISISKKGRVQASTLIPEYKKHLENNNEPMFKKGNQRVRNAKKIYGTDGELLADSKLEYKLKTWLDTNNIPYEFQQVFVLCETTKCLLTNKTIRSMTWKIDFVFPDKMLAIDAKGFVTEIAKLKYKVFKKLYPEWNIVFVKNIKELMYYLNEDKT